MLHNLRISDEDQIVGKVTEDFAHVEDMLDDCLSSLSHYTGNYYCCEFYSSVNEESLKVSLKFQMGCALALANFSFCQSSGLIPLYGRHRWGL